MIRWPFMSRRKSVETITLAAHDQKCAWYQRQIESLKDAVAREQSTAKYHAHMVVLATNELITLRATSQPRDPKTGRMLPKDAASAAKRKERENG